MSLSNFLRSFFDISNLVTTLHISSITKLNLVSTCLAFISSSPTKKKFFDYFMSYQIRKRMQKACFLSSSNSIL